MRTTLFEIKQFEHKGIMVTVRIDYESGTVALVERHINQYSAKDWQFSGRGLEYMNGWLNIIDAMRNAVVEAKKLLEHDLAEQTKFKENKLIKLSMQEMKDLKKKK